MSEVGHGYLNGLRGALDCMHRSQWTEAREVLSQCDELLAAARQRGAWMDEVELKQAQALFEECLETTSRRRDTVRDEARRAGLTRSAISAYGQSPTSRDRP
jgi:sugar phosphate isomerase/epimerase